jgi:hypothetical protein
VPYASLERRREASAAWSAKVRSTVPLGENVEGWDEQWVILSCSRCHAFFDVGRRSGRRPSLCEDCR